MGKKRKRRGFTLIELMVVILIVGVLVAVAVPILRGKNEAAKWSEAAATSGAIRTAVRAKFAEDPTTIGKWKKQPLNPPTRTTLGFTSGDLTGRYFKANNFKIASVDANGNATITATAPAGLTGTGQLDSANGWVYTP
ncbi:MAG: prepilin-type N-terminal cleavage/methylation domain-containing protein [Planctomycetes bacterium]|nr:prepilin-type N-terminal cleavage/methylation domain-containing protein [Planctomycetota bacterium]